MGESWWYTEKQFDKAKNRGTLYQIINHRLYRHMMLACTCCTARTQVRSVLSASVARWGLIKVPHDFKNAFHWS